jgi:hypothetical protein
MTAATKKSWYLLDGQFAMGNQVTTDTNTARICIRANSKEFHFFANLWVGGTNNDMVCLLKSSD